MKFNAFLACCVASVFLVETVTAQGLSDGATYLATANNQIRSFDSSGNLLDTIGIQYATGAYPATEYARDLTVLGNGNIAVYNGTFNAYLSIYDFQTLSWSHHTNPGFGTFNNGSYGGIGVLEDNIYLTDMDVDGTSGLLQFNQVTEEFTLFSEGIDFRDVTVGLDNKIYGVSGGSIRVFNPDTLLQEELIPAPLGHDMRGVVASEDGRIFSVTWNEMLYEYDRDGNIVNSLDIDPFMSSFGDPHDLDIRADGSLLFGHRFGKFYLSDLEFSNVVEFEADDFNGTFVAFVNVLPDPGRTADVDIKPGSCPNSFNRTNKGFLPVGLLGTKDFDVTTVDLSSLLISRADGIGGMLAQHEGPPGPHSTIEDVGTPFEGDPCECHELIGDGIDDLSLKFKSNEIVDVLELNNLPAGALVELVVSGNLVDGTLFSGSDCIRLVPRGIKRGIKRRNE